ncbi:selenocysteine lyase isoform X2 [Alligator sinensis]|uniref:Selenocysteine lyase n=1 Tax=Alligator sinensis TaxID=38654 RepID=A0A3Q0GZW5_ALLSI|nr:selenocysteine lyase isoform X2 [Alligator sinensis]
MEKDKVRKVIPAKDGRKIPRKTECYEEENNSVKRKVYMDYNATTPLALEVIQTVTEAMQEAWGNPSSTYKAGRKAKETISRARESLARMVGGQPEDIIFTSGGTEANNLIIHTALRCFRESWVLGENGPGEKHSKPQGATPHFVTSSVEHDSVRLPLEHLVRENMAEATFVPVSKVTGQAEVDDIIGAVRPTTCLVSIMLANNETGVIMPIPELCQRIRILNQKRTASGMPKILVHTDAAQMIGKGRVDVEDLGVDYLTVVGHKAAELVNKTCEVYEAHMQEVRDYLEARLEAVFGKQKIHFNSRFSGSRRLCNTCNFSILGSGLQGHKVLSCCKTLLASVGAACHSEKGDNQPSSILLSCGIPYDVAQNALRLSVGRDTTHRDVDLVVDDLKEAVAQLEQSSTPLT